MLGTSDLVNFFVHVRSFLSNLVISARKRLPFHDSVISDISCLDPGERTTSTPGMIRRLVERFSHLVPIECCDLIEEQFSLYQTTKYLPQDLLQLARIDHFWGEIGKIESSTGKPYGLLSNFAKCLLCIPHGNADSERMFSCINLIGTDHRNQLDTSTIQACLDIKLNSTVRDCYVYEPSQDVIKATRKVTPGSELFSKGKAPCPSFTSSSTSSCTSHQYSTRFQQSH